MQPAAQPIESILAAAVEMSSEAERRQFVDQACAGDTALKRRLEELIENHFQAGNFLESPAAHLVATADEPSVSERPGCVIGPYKLLEQIGEGGFGVVFMAEQQQPVRRKVALKVLKPGMDTRQVVARFEAERQALALMDHPNIARVFDGGTTGEPGGVSPGRPYFIMELVKGIPITEYCDQTQLTPRERLALFLPVCQAVQHAHQKGIIHRDLKPSNVLVTLHDGTAVPKIIDFGIAKALGQQLTDKTLYTGFAQLVGTPLYMSPEQAALSGLDVDTRSDIYALGVLLYELLTGTTPFDKERLHKAGYDELRRIIREEEPPKPSTRISTLGQAATPLSAQRKSDPKRLSQLFRGELDWIVMKCLEKDRNRRYETANGLARDIERYLRDEPVQACPPSALYRFRKLARRNKGILLAAAVVVVALVVGTLVSTWQWVRARQAGSLAQTRLERETEARQEADSATTQAIRERDQAQHRLYDARLAQAQASRWSGRAGRRFASLQALAEAARLAQDLELGPAAILTLRNEAIACTALVDLRLDQKWPGFAPGSTLTGTAFDADMQRYARVDENGHITVRRLADNQETLLITDTGAPASPHSRMRLVFSPDGRFLAAAGHTELAVPLQVWDLTGPKSILKAAPAGGYERTIDFSSDSHMLAARSSDQSSLALYDVSAATELKRWRIGPPLDCLRFHPQGRQVAVGCGPHVHVLDLDGRPVMPPISHPRRISMVSWSADGRLLATACDDGQAYVWDATTGKNQAICKGHQHGVISVAFSHRGELLATSSEDETTRIWDPTTGKELFSTNGIAADFSRDERWLGFGAYGPDVGRWEVATAAEYRPLHGHQREASVTGLDISSDGRLLASAAGDGVGLWDVAAGKLIATLPCGQTYSAIFDPSGRVLITSGVSGLYRWPIRFGREPMSAPLQLGPAEPVRQPPGCRTRRASLSADGRTLAVTTNLNEGWLLDLERPNEKPRFLHYAVTSIAISPDAKWVGTNAAEAFESKLWDAEDGKWVRDFPGMRTAGIAFSPDNHWLVFMTAQEYIFHQVGTWQPGPRVRRDYGGYSPGPLAFSGDGKMVAIAYSARSIRLIDSASGREIATLAAPVPETLQALCFSPDATRLAAGTSNGVIQLWDLHRIREQLREMGLDWDPPANGPRKVGDPRPLQVEVDAGELLDREKYSLILAFFPFQAEAYFHRGLGQVRFEQWQQALEDFNMTLALNPDHAGALYQRGLIHAGSGRFAEAVEDYSRTLAIQSGPVEAYAHRGHALAELGQWEKAAADFEKGMEQKETPAFVCYQHALLRLHLGDTAGYRQACSRMLDRFGDTREGAIADIVAWTCVLAADAVPDASRPLRLAERAGASDPGTNASLRTLGAALYRACRFAEAVKRLDEATAVYKRGGDWRQPIAYTWLFLAMAHHRLGHALEARRWLDQAVQEIDRPTSQNAKNAARNPWNRRLTLQLLRREAEALVNGQEK
jgi:serine/threonine protein kinase/WD40 repeat protein